MLTDALINPDDNVPATDRVFQPDLSTPGWTEHYAFFAHDPDKGYGTFIHIGRVTEDPTIWRGVIQVYLPDGELLVGKYFGRDPGDGSATAGPLRLFAEVPFRKFVVDFDGMLHRTTRADITDKVFVDTTAEPVKMHVEFEAAAPIQGRQGEQQDRAVSTFHTDQVGAISGTIKVKDENYAFKGVGVRDHSNGPRDYRKIISHLWIHGLFPSGLAFSVVVLRTNSNPTLRSASIFRGDGSPREFVELTEFPDFPEDSTSPNATHHDPVEDANFRKCHIAFQTSAGPLRIDIEPVHTHAITYVEPCDELVGTDRSRPDGVQMCDAPAIFRCNGERGSGLFERSARVGVLL
jgi:hypothetical protein